MLIKPLVRCWPILEHVDLLAERLKLENLIPSEVQEYFFWIKMICMKCIIQCWNTQQSKSLSLEKTLVSREINWNKGQYLYLKMEPFLISSSEGYVVTMQCNKKAEK
jgi:hypothetical protein